MVRVDLGVGLLFSHNNLLNLTVNLTPPNEIVTCDV